MKKKGDLHQDTNLFTTPSLHIFVMLKNLGLFVFNVATIRQRKEHKCILTSKCLSYIKCGVVLKETNMYIRMGKYECVSAGTVSILHRIILR